MSCTGPLDAATFNAQQTKLANLQKWGSSELGRQLWASGCLPEHHLEWSPWPFESRLMNLIVARAERGLEPPIGALFLLTASSDSGEIEPGMQPARPDSQGRIDRLCAALTRIVAAHPEVVKSLRLGSAKTLEDRSQRLWLEQAQGPSQQHHHHHQEELLGHQFPAPPAAFAAGPVFAPAPGTAAEPIFIDDRAIFNWRLQPGESFSSLLADAMEGVSFDPVPEAEAEVLDDATTEELVGPSPFPVPDPEVGPEGFPTLPPLEDVTAWMLGLFGPPVPEASTLPPLDDAAAMDLFDSTSFLPLEGPRPSDPAVEYSAEVTARAQGIDMGPDPDSIEAQVMFLANAP